jgi:amino acid adenylation domain-containing protein
MIIKIFEEQVKKFQDKIALKMETGALTYGELNRWSNHLAVKIKGRGLPWSGEKHPIVALLFEHGFDMIVGLIGALKANLIYVPLDRAHPESRLTYMLEDAGVCLILTNRENFPLAERLKEKANQEMDVMDIHDVDWDNLGENVEREVFTRKPAYILYTSGSTGKPKGVIQNHENVLYYTRNWTERFSITACDRMTLLTAFVHDGAVQDIWGALHSGASLYPYDVKNIVAGIWMPEFIARERITIWHSVPTLFRYFVESLEAGGSKLLTFPNLRFILLGGESIRKRDIDILKQYFPNSRLANVYGQTESSVSSIIIYRAGDSFGVPVLGVPLDKTWIYLVNEEDEIVEDIGVGEIVIACDHLALGYWKDPEKTKEKFTYDPEIGKLYWTGDLGGLKANGDIELMGRKDFQIKIRGFRVEVGEIETVLLQHEAVKEAVVVLKEDERTEQYLCCYFITFEPLETLDTEQLREYLLHRVPDYMIPRIFIQMEKLPLTASGKINRNVLPEPEVEVVEPVVTPPANKWEQQLAEIWGEELGTPLERIGREAHFFELGGHSLRAINLIAKVHQRFHVKLELEDIFAFPLLKELSRLIETKGEDLFQPIPLAEEKEYYPLSSAQERIYILQELEPENIAYNISDIIEWPGQLDRERIEQTFRQMINRHESMRTSFLMVNDEPVQRIHGEKHVDFKVEYYDLIGDQVDVKVKVKEIMSYFVRSFDLSQPPLFRIAIINLGESRHLMLSDIHHIIMDGVSQQLFVQEFQHLYLEGELPQPALQYYDYSQWQNSWQRREDIKQQEEYWFTRFAGEIPVLDLPADYKRPVAQRFEGNNLRFALTAEETLSLRNIGKKQDATLFMVMLAVMNVFLFKLTGQEDIVIGTPTAGRRHADLAAIIGMLVNTLVLRNYPNSRKTFRHFLKEVREHTMAAFENQDYQFEDLVEKVSPTRDLSRNPLFDVMLALHNQAELPENSPHLIDYQELQTRDSYRFEGMVSLFDLTVHAVEAGKVLGFSWEYSTALFKKESIGRFFGYFRNTIANIIENPDRLLAEIEIITKEEKWQILHEFNDTGAAFPGPGTLHELFAEQAERSCNGTALVCPTDHIFITYNELDKKCDKLACFLRKKGVKPDSVVGLMVDPSLEMVIGMLSVLKAGGAYLPIDMKTPENRKKIIIRESNMILLLVNQLVEDLIFITGENIEIIDIRDQRLYSRDGNPIKNKNKTADLAYVIYTSGSTGIPKGVMLEHRNLINLMHFHHRLTGMDCTRVTQFASIGFDISFYEIFSTLLAGGILYVLNKDVRTDIVELCRILKEDEIKTTFLPISFLKMIFNEENYADQFPGNIRHIQTAGEQLVVIDRFRMYLKENNVYLHNHYGPSEAHVVTTLTLDPEGEIPDLPPIGKPVSNTHIYIVAPYSFSHLQPVGVTGELVIGGAQVGRGYLNNPELTAEKFDQDLWDYQDYHDEKKKDNEKFLGVQGPFFKKVPGRRRLYKTGDLARWLEDGNIEFLGRVDFQVKIRGFRVELEEIENFLMKINSIKEALVMEKVSGNDERYLCAYVSAVEEVNASKLREVLAVNLPDYMIPSCFIQLERIPVKPNGKVDRKALPEPEIAPAKDYTAPANKIEKQLVWLWSEVLGIEESKISTSANFFELGGHSLKATILVSKIHKILAVKVPLAEIFKAPSIKGLGGYIAGAAVQKFSPIERVGERPFYPLSSAQKRLYILQQMEKDNYSYNMPVVVTLGGMVEKEKIENTLRKIIRHHESFRTSFELMRGEPVQRIRKDVEFDMEYYDISAVEVKVAVEEDTLLPDSPEAIIETFIRPFDLSRAPLLRAGLIKLDAAQYILMLDMHHIICDGTSRGLFINDFAVLYNGQQLQELKLRYRDFACWQNSPVQQEAMRKQKVFWLEQYADEIPVLNLPVDFPRASIRNFAGTHVDFLLEDQEAEALKALSLRSESTLFMVLLAVYNVLLSKLSGQEDIVVGTPIAGRRHADLEGIVGMFANTLALRNYLQSEKTFYHMLLEVKQFTLEAFENQDYQFEDLVDEVVDVRDTSRNPIFDVMLVLLNMDAPEIETQALSVKPYPLEGKTAKFDLNLSGIEAGKRLFFSLEYSTAIFKKETILKFIDYFTRLVRTITANPDIPLSQIEMMGKNEKEEVLRFSCGPGEALDESLTIHRWFEEQAEKTPDCIAILGNELGCMDAGMQGNISITYRGLNEKSHQVACILKEKGVLANDIVAIMMERSVEMIFGILGILKAGGAYLPIEPDYPEERKQYMLADSSTRILLTNLSEGHHFHHSSLITHHSGNLAYAIYTSGSTGWPKGVMLEHRNLVNLMRYHQQYINLPCTRVTQFASIGFDVSFQEIFSTLLAGGTLYLVEKKLKTDIPELCRFIRGNYIETLYLPVSFLKAIFSDEDYASLFPGIVKHIVCAGEQLVVIDRFRNYLQENNVYLHNHYGPSETHVVTGLTLAPSDDIPELPTIGKPICNTSIYIVDKGMQLQPKGVAGELFAGGIAVGRGYLNNPELTAERFLPVSPRSCRTYGTYISSKKIYKTGDLARWLGDGNIEFLGRIDHQVKIRGFRVEPGEIENRLMNIPGVREAVVIDGRNEDGEKYLCAYIVTAGDMINPDISRLRDLLSRQLPVYMVPAYFVKLEAIPLTPSGKIDKRAFPKPMVAAAAAYQPPTNPVEEKLVNLVCDILRVEKVGINDNFFELGANSLTIIKLVSEIYKEFETEVPIMQIFQDPRICEISKYIFDKKFLKGEEDPALILNPSQSQTLFCFPPGIGYGVSYIGFAEILKDYTFYSFNFMEGDDRIDRYVELIIKYQPEGPYCLLGYSAGGELTIEVANRLEQKGHKVSRIILLDSYRTTRNWESSTLDQFVDTVVQGLEVMGIGFLKEKVMQKVNNYTQYLKNLHHTPLAPVNAVIHLITAEDRKEREARYISSEEEIDWEELTWKECITHKGSGIHVHMLTEGHIERNASIVRGILTGKRVDVEEAPRALPITKEIQEVHHVLSEYSVKFLEFVNEDQERLKRSNYQKLVHHDEFFKLNPWPTFACPRLQGEIRAAALTTFRLVKSVPRRIFGNDTGKMSEYYEIPENMIQTQLKGVTDGFIDCLMGRGDFVLTLSGFKCLEYNISANVGGMQVPVWEYLYLTNPIVSHFLQEHHIKVNNKNLLSIFLEYVGKTALTTCEHSNSDRTLNIAIVSPGYQYQEETASGPQSSLLELNELYKETLQRVTGGSDLTGTVILCDFNHLQAIDDFIYYKYRDKRSRISILIELYGGVVPPEIMAVFKAGHITLFNGPITGLLSNKLNLALLSEYEDSPHFSDEEKHMITTYIPWTRKILPVKTKYRGKQVQLMDFISANKENFVIKPAVGYGGERIFIGKFTSQKEWEKWIKIAIEERKWLVQEYIQSLPLIYQVGESGMEPHQTIWGFFVFGSIYGGGCIRVLPQSNKAGVVNAAQGAVSSVILEVDR